MSATVGQDLRPVLEAFDRARTYGLLARVLADPANLRNEAVLPELSRVAAASRDGLFREDVDALVSAAAELRGSPRTLDQEYTRLFLKSEAPPYEGSYVPNLRLVQEIADVAGFYGAFGVRPRGDRADHLVGELEFMALLCLKEAVARGEGLAEGAELCRDARAKFLRDHLGRWLALYERVLSERAMLPVYPLAARAVRRFVEADAARLGVKPELLMEVSEHDAESLPRCGLPR